RYPHLWSIRILDLFFDGGCDSAGQSDCRKFDSTEKQHAGVTSQELQTTHKPVIQWKEFWLLVALVIICFDRAFFSSDTFFFLDLYLYYVPQKQFYVRILRGGELPLWDPYLHGGQPFLGNVQNLALYPTNLLYLIFPLLNAFNIDLVLHVILCALGSYWFARRLG